MEGMGMVHGDGGWGWCMGMEGMGMVLLPAWREGEVVD